MATQSQFNCFAAEINDYRFVNLTTSDPTTGSAADADELPTVDVFEEENDTPIITVTMVKRTGQTGLYRAKIEFTAANDFIEGKEYIGVANALVGGVSGKIVVFNVKIENMNTRASIAASITEQTPSDFVPDMTADPEPTPVNSPEEEFGAESSFEFKDIFVRFYDTQINEWTTENTDIVSAGIRTLVFEHLGLYEAYLENKALWDIRYEKAKEMQYRVKQANYIIDWAAANES